MFKCGYCGAEFPSEEEAASHMMKHLAEQVEKQQQATAQTYLLMAASQLTQICLISGRGPEEAMQIFTRVYDLLNNWHCGTQPKDDFMKWLEKQWGENREPG